MPRFFILVLTVILSASMLTACEEKTEKNVSQDEVVDTIKTELLDKWIGQWNGPEGTYLIIEKSGAGYNIRIKDLDGEKSYLGVQDGAAISFHRDDHKEKIYDNNGAGTGMKWLEPYADCLMTKPGEGWCRDYNPGKTNAPKTP